jgi:hypothetical protein
MRAAIVEASTAHMDTLTCTHIPAHMHTHSRSYSRSRAYITFHTLYWFQPPLTMSGRAHTQTHTHLAYEYAAGILMPVGDYGILCVRACVRVRVRVCVCARACVCMRAHTPGV